MDVERFKQLYLPFHPKLYRVAFALLGNREDAEDLLQEAYAKLWERREELDRISNPEAFAIILLKNKCLDFLRSARKVDEEEPTDHLMGDLVPSPHQQLEEREQVRQVQRLIRQLPVGQQQVIRLHGLQDYSLEEIGTMTGFSPSNVRQLLSRARKTIREQLTKWYSI
ncbi:MAG: RNA polymerase sigma factor [Parabacteroides sp.]